MPPRAPRRGFPGLTQRLWRGGISNKERPPVVLPTTPRVPCTRDLSVSTSAIFRPALLTCRTDKATYPHFNIYPSWVRALVLPARDVPRRKVPRKSHKELHEEIVPRLHTIPDDTEVPKVANRLSRRHRGMTIVAKRPEPVEKPRLPQVRKVSLVLRRVSSLNLLNGQNTSPPRPRVSPEFDGLPSVETRLLRSEYETAKSSDADPVVLTRSQSLSARPSTPKRRQSALIAQRIKALSVNSESPEPVPDRPARRSTRSLPITPTSACG